MLIPRSPLVLLSVALLTGVSGCKKSEEAAPAADTAAVPADAATPAPEPAAAPDQASAPAPEPQPAAAPVQPVVVTPTAAGLPGAADVTAALARKDYPGAVAALTRTKALTRPEQQVEYNALLRQVMVSLYEVKDTDASARQAFNALRAIQAGR